jgi:serine/threonine protein kinase
MRPEARESKPPVSSPAPLTIGRYILHAPIARGGMATIHIGRLTGAEGFSRMVAAKRLHPEFIEDAEFVAMFLDEARIASKVHHPNVVPVLDVVTTGTEIVLVQEYIHGVPLSILLKTARKQKVPVPIPIAVTVMSGVLAGLHAAHETKDELGQPLEIVHRDVSPQNVMVAVDGTPRLLDFGVAKATLSAHVTREGTFKGKVGYTAPEQLRGAATRSSDIYSAGVMLWEALVGRRLHQGTTEPVMITRIVTGEIPTLSFGVKESRASVPQERWDQLTALEPIVSRAMALDPAERFATAADFATAMLAAVHRVSDDEVAQWAKELGKDFIAGRDKIIAGDEVSWRRAIAGPDSGPLLDRSYSDPPRSGVGELYQPRDGPPPPIEPSRRWLIWVIALLLLLLGATGGAIAFLIMQPTAIEASAPPSVAAMPPQPTATPQAAALPVLTAPAPTTTAQDPEPTAPPTSKPDLVRTSPIHVLPLRTQHPPPLAPARRPNAPSQPPPQAQAATPAEPDCNPPFYFEGHKKVYKPGCI